MATVLVTGGAGSMGRLVCSRLAAEGHAIRAFDLATANFEGLGNGISVLPGDLTSKTDLKSAIEAVDVVVQSLLCNLFCAFFVQSELCNLCCAICAVQSELCNLCFVILAVEYLLSNVCRKPCEAIRDHGRP